jgi:tryptophan synthase alpha chain
VTRAAPGTLERAIRAARSARSSALVPFIVAGRPSRASFGAVLERVAPFADALEIGLPFSDPIADGPTIARAGRAALADGVELDGLCAELAGWRAETRPALVLMSYMNPLYARGPERALDELVRAGFSGLIVPDCPLEESGELGGLAREYGLALVQMATPLTPRERLLRLAAETRGFLYAVARTGITGAATSLVGLSEYLDGLRRISPAPICVGFGIRTPEQARTLAPHADGLIVGSALVELVERGEDPADFLGDLQRALSESVPAPLAPPLTDADGRVRPAPLHRP